MENNLFPQNGIFYNGRMYVLEDEDHESCEFCDLSPVCWQEWQPCGTQPCTCFGLSNAIFKERAVPIQKDCRFNFGKYNGKPVSEIIESNPQYVAWAVKNVKWFNIDEDLRRKLAIALKRSHNHSFPFSRCSEDGEIAGLDAFGSIY